MFIILLRYKTSLDVIDTHLATHRAFLKEGYKKHYFIASGPQNPRTGGVILSALKSRSELEAFMQQDPFQIHDVAEYQFIEFDPAMHDEGFARYL